MDMNPGKEKKKLMIEEKIKKKDEVQERCVFCGKLVDISKNTMIKQRKYYVEGAGQLCAICYTEIYIPSHNANIINL